MDKQYRKLIGILAVAALVATSWVVSSQLVFAQQNTYQVSSNSYRREVIKTFSQTQFQKEMETISREGWELILVNEGADYSHEIITYWRRVR